MHGVRGRARRYSRSQPRMPCIRNEVPMNRRTLAAVALLAASPLAHPRNRHPYGPPTVTPPYDSIVMTEPVAGSDIPVDIMLLETVDGLLTPIGMRKPRGAGPSPSCCCSRGNGGAGIPAVPQLRARPRRLHDERFLDAGYAVAWITYRAEAWFAYETAQAAEGLASRGEPGAQSAGARVQRPDQHHRGRAPPAVRRCDGASA